MHSHSQRPSVQAISCVVNPQVLSFSSAAVLPPQPPGRSLGTFLGLQLGMGLQWSDVRLAFDPTFGRSMPMAYAGALAGLCCSCTCKGVINLVHRRALHCFEGLHVACSEGA